MDLNLIAAGKVVVHASHGRGIVLSRDDLVKVRFQALMDDKDHGVRWVEAHELNEVSE
jgi:hypothetical protein